MTKIRLPTRPNLLNPKHVKLYAEALRQRAKTARHHVMISRDLANELADLLEFGAGK